MNREDAQNLIDQAAEGERLTTWELEFLESVTEQVDERGFLSPKQAEVLERIIEEKG